MRIGTIVKNGWAGEGNPLKYFIYTGVSGKYATGISLENGRLIKIRYYKKDLKETRDGEDVFQIVGYSTGIDLLKEDLKRFL